MDANRGPVSSPEEAAPARAFDPARLKRAVALLKGAERMGPSEFRVRGQDEPEYYVNLDGDPVCYCKDSEYHGRGCKHELAALLLNGDLRVIGLLGELLLVQEKAKSR